MPTDDWAPVLADVGAVLRMRTRTVTGDTIGTFNTITTPTGDQVTPLIDQATADVASEIGADLDPKFWDNAKSVAALSVAMGIELGFYGEQVAVGRSPYPQLKELFDQRLGRLKAQIDSAGGIAPPDADLLPSPTFGDQAGIGGACRPVGCWNGDNFDDATWPAPFPFPWY